MFVETLQDPSSSLATIVNARKNRIVSHGAYADEHHRLALNAAHQAYAQGAFDTAETWALRALHDGASYEAFCLLGDICEQLDFLTDALRWYRAAAGYWKAQPVRQYETPLTAAAHEYRIRTLLRKQREHWQSRDLWQALPLAQAASFAHFATLPETLQAARDTAKCTVWGPPLHDIAPVPANMALISTQHPSLHVPAYGSPHLEPHVHVFKMPMRTPLFGATVIVSPATAHAVPVTCTTNFELAQALQATNHPAHQLWGIVHEPA